MKYEIKSVAKQTIYDIPVVQIVTNVDDANMIVLFVEDKILNGVLNRTFKFPLSSGNPVSTDFVIHFDRAFDLVGVVDEFNSAVTVLDNTANVSVTIRYDDWNDYTQPYYQFTVQEN